MRSVADYNNYGDEPEAVDLLFPSTATELGITEADFQQLRDRQAIKDLFEKIGHSFKIGKFNTLYNKAKELCPSQDDKVSVRAFMQALQNAKKVIALQSRANERRARSGILPRRFEQSPGTVGRAGLRTWGV